MTSRAAGILYGLVSSATFGLIPLFTLPLLGAGIPVQTALVYRFGIAAAVLALIICLARESLVISPKALATLAGLSLFYMAAVLFYFYALAMLPSGVVATIQFLFPVMVMVIMICFFHEPFRWKIAISVTLAVAGVALLSLGESMTAPSGANHVIMGVILSLLAGLTNGLYFIGLQVAKLPKINDLVLTFYVMLFGAILCLINAVCSGSLAFISQGRELGIALLLALITAVISNITLILAIRRVGSTITSIMGVLEPLTAVAVGTMVFNEPFTTQLAAGVVLILLSVLLVLKGPAAEKE